MAPSLPDTLQDEDTEFDLDVRLEALDRHVPVDRPIKPSDQCPAGTPSMYGCSGNC